MHTVKQRALSLSAAAALALTLAACGSNTAQTGSESSGREEQDLVLSQDQVTLDGQVLSEGEDGAVTLSHDIVYYQEGQGSDYGEGTAQEEHSAGEADAHLVVTIREAGTYRVSGELTQGQLAVDLGEDAQDDPSAVVTVILDGVDVTCTVAPAFMVYNVYECGSTDVETASPTVDTAAAGINVVLADADGNGLLTFTTEKAAQSLTFSSADLKQDVDYTLTVDGVTQEYTGHQSGGFGGAPGGMGGGPGGNMMEIPDGLESWLSSVQDVPDDIRTWLEGLLEMQNSQPDRPDGGTGEAATPPEGQEEPPQDNGQSGRGDPGAGGTEAASGEASTLFTLSDGVHSFSGVTDSAQDSMKTSVSFTADLSVGEDGTVSLSNIQASQEVDSSHVQLTITDVPSENYAASCLLSDGDEAIAAILPTDPGTYQLTIAMSGDDSYTGSSQFTFTIPE